MNVPGTGTGTGTDAGARIRKRARRRLFTPRDDRGQAAIEFTGMVPVILATLALLWQATLVGYAFSLAGNAADEAVRAGTAGGDCHAAAAKDLPGGWVGGATCGAEGDLYTADVHVEIPVLFPGFNIPVNVTGHAAAANEEG